jgi:lipid II isoglutaminyl synthase (glutamine-hydrolysing)
MGLRFTAARAVSAVSTWGLKNVFRRPAANFPGKIALYVDPQLIAHLRGKLKRGSVCVVGTNGKTTVTNLLADVLETAGQTVVCNRTGANLDSGVSTALLHAKQADWGIFESDELWLAKILPHLQADYVLLLNLFRDQLDRCGEIDRIQDSIVGALGSSPNTVLIYNADDPLCASIADRAGQLPGREHTKSIAFGVSDCMGLEQNTVTDATMCQRCSTMFEYDWRQYGQLGEWRCPNCGFSRPTLDYAATDVKLGADGLAFELGKPGAGAGKGAGSSQAGASQAGAANGVANSHGTDHVGDFHIEAPFSGAYMVYNLEAVGVAASLLGCGNEPLQQAITAFDPQNGRLQAYDLAGRHILLNLAKNPTGFNQNLKIVAQDQKPKVVAFFINDREADGHDVSWLWDIDFEELAQAGPLVAYAGGIRGRDMAVRLKYAGIESEVVEDANDLLSRVVAQPTEVSAYIIANYTSLPGCKAALDAACADGATPVQPAEGEVPQARDFGVSAGEKAIGSNSSATGRAGADNAANVTAASQTDVTAPTGTTDDAMTADPAGAAGAAGAAAGTTLASPIVVAHLFPDLLNLYGDGGNVRVLEQRLNWRGIPVEVRRVRHGDSVDLAQVDLIMMGGSPDREQKLASADIVAMRDDLAAYVEDEGPLLAICGSYQMLGREWLVDGEKVPGLGLVGMTTGRPGTSADRLVNNIALKSDLASAPVIGYENHAGRTYLDEGVQAFGTVVSNTGLGNNEETKQDGVRYKNVLGTYLHGPLLAKNPQIADWLLERALERHAKRTGAPALELTPLDDAAETAANDFMAGKLGAK